MQPHNCQAASCFSQCWHRLYRHKPIKRPTAFLVAGRKERTKCKLSPKTGQDVCRLKETTRSRLLPVCGAGFRPSLSLFLSVSPPVGFLFLSLFFTPPISPGNPIHESRKIRFTVDRLYFSHYDNQTRLYHENLVLKALLSTSLFL